LTMPSVKEIFTLLAKKHILICLILLFVTTHSFSQSRELKEIDDLSNSIIKQHLDDSFYIHIRPLPGVRMGIEDYVFKHDGKNWLAHYSYKKTIGVKKRTKITVKKAAANTIAERIHCEKLLQSPTSDSIHMDNSKLLLGTSNYFIIICSRGKVRTIEYPIIIHYNYKIDWREQNIYWQSDYLDTFIEEMKKAFPTIPH
jgi:hypothetical protein